jgi:hypothetical protein
MGDTGAEIVIPSSLRPVSPFLEEAKIIVRNASSTGRKGRAAIYCIDHAFHLIEKYDLVLDHTADGVVKAFHRLRGDLLKVNIDAFLKTILFPLYFALTNDVTN